MKRKIQIKDQQTKDLVNKKYQIIEEGKKNAKEAEKLKQKNLKLEEKLKPIKEKLLKAMAEMEKDIELGEFEQGLTTTKEKDKYYLVIEDALEAFKEHYKKQYEQSNQQGSGETNASK